jgi:hypothetical protein
MLAIPLSSPEVGACDSIPVATQDITIDGDTLSQQWKKIKYNESGRGEEGDGNSLLLISEATV